MTALPILRDIVFGVQDSYLVLNLSRMETGRLGTKPDALTRREDVYPHGENAYALANPHNFQSMFKAGQLLRAIVLDSASLPCLHPTWLSQGRLKACEVRLCNWVSLETMSDGDKEWCRVQDDCTQ